jgi:ribosomal protein S12 methylthiotransferase accessory factor
LAKTLLGDPPARRTIWSNRFPELLDLATLRGAPRRLVERFAAAAVQVSVLDMTSDLGVPAFRAAAIDMHLEGTMVHATFGRGAHPTAEVALTRALTEAAQGRVTVIQGAREDLSGLGGEGQLQPKYPVSARGTRRWADVPTACCATVRDDIRLMLAALRRAGIRRCLVKDLTQPGIEIPVVRVIVPELEDWVSAAMHGHSSCLGLRALSRIR